MDLSKLRIMQQIQIALVGKGLRVSVESNDEFQHICIQGHANNEVLEWLYDSDATEAELQLWHDTIVYGPQVTVKEGE